MTINHFLTSLERKVDSSACIYMSVSKGEHSPFSPQWVNRKLYTLMLVIYTPRELNTDSPLVIDDLGSEIKVQESITDCNKSWLLLGLKQSGFGKGRWNGFGGKVELSDANPKAAALRELNEESGLTLDESSVDEVGRLWFTFAETLECMEVHVFICRTWTPTFNGHTVKWPCYTEEMHPAWFPLIMNKDNTINTSSLPWEHMWPDDLLWVPDILQGNLILAWFHYLRLSNLSITNSQNLIDRSTETNGISIDLYEIPAYHLESFTTDENELLSADKDNDCKLSSVQRIIDRLDLDKNDNNLRLWMSSSLYDNEFVVSPLILQKILHYPI
ncbi:unnamed protein product [Schistosoma curassoni]|nr:unnamed protein product [Schistosoma curassoni]